MDRKLFPISLTRANKDFSLLIVVVVSVTSVDSSVATTGSSAGVVSVSSPSSSSEEEEDPQIPRRMFCVIPCLGRICDRREVTMLFAKLEWSRPKRELLVVGWKPRVDWMERTHAKIKVDLIAEIIILVYVNLQIQWEYCASNTLGW